MKTAFDEAMAELNELQGSNAIIYGMPRIVEVSGPSTDTASDARCETGASQTRVAPATFREKVVTWAAGLILIDLIFAAGIRAVDLYMKWRR